MGAVAGVAVAAAALASLALASQRLARVPAWPLLTWLLLAHAVPPTWRLSWLVPFLGCLVVGYAVLASSPLLATVWAVAAAAQVLFRSKPSVEFELM